MTPGGEDGEEDFNATAKINQSETRRSIVTDADVDNPTRFNETPIGPEPSPTNVKKAKSVRNAGEQ